MNIYDLRRCLRIINFHSHSEGATIFYLKAVTTDTITLSREELINELIIIGSLDEDSDSEYIADYFISQWDALNIAIRHELAKDQENDLNKSDIFKALGNIINPTHGQRDAY